MGQIVIAVIGLPNDVDEHGATATALNACRTAKRIKAADPTVTVGILDTEPGRTESPVIDVLLDCTDIVCLAVAPDAAVVVLGWENDRGACHEVGRMNEAGIPVFENVESVMEWLHGIPETQAHKHTIMSFGQPYRLRKF
jgi:hypothetical protein